jgi:tRNA(fMet)-specific endonuclease VapC
VKFLLDSNAVIALFKGNTGVVRQVMQLLAEEIGLSAIVLHELYFGASKSDRAEANLARIDRLEFERLDYTTHDALVAGDLRAVLAAKGTPISPYDVLIAGQAFARDLTVVTHNTREFSRVPGLRVEDWQS